LKIFSQYSEYLQELDKQKTQFGPKKSNTKEKEVRFKEDTNFVPKESLKYPQPQSSGDLENLD